VGYDERASSKRHDEVDDIDEDGAMRISTKMAKT